MEGPDVDVADVMALLRDCVRYGEESGIDWEPDLAARIARGACKPAGSRRCNQSTLLVSFRAWWANARTAPREAVVITGVWPPIFASRLASRAFSGWVSDE